MTAQTNFLKVEQDLGKWFLGLKEENEILLAALAARLPILMEGAHGTAKSTIAKRIAKYFGKTAFYRQIKASMTIYDVFYEYDLALLMKGERKIIPKALGAEFVILDEALAHPILLSAIHDFIEDRSVDGVPASWRFCMFATNPKNEFYESSTLALSNFATLDRFAVINYLNPPRTYDLFELGLRTEKQFKPPDPDFSVPTKVLDEAWAEVEKVKIPLEIHLRLQLLLSALSECSYTPSAGQTGKEAKEINKWMLMGSSVESLCGTCRYRNEICGKATASPTRAQRAVIWLSKALAWLHEKDVGLEEFERALAHVMPHRIFYVPSFMREHPTAQNAFQSLYGMYQKDMLKRQNQGAFKLLTDIYKKLSAGAWDKASYDQLILNFADDLPLRKFVEGLKRKRYAEVKAALYEAVEKTSDMVQLGVMKGQITTKGLDFEDEVELGKLIDKKLAGDTTTFTVKVPNDTRGKVIGKITTVMSRYADARELHTFLFDRVTPSRQFATFAITKTEDGFTIVTLDKDTAESVRKKLPEAQEAQP